MATNEYYAGNSIWTFQNPRTSCLIPEVPLLISEAEEIQLNELSLGIYNAVAVAVELAREVNERPWNDLFNTARAFPDGLTMPPAIRTDIVRTVDGPKVVEIDPVTAISLGETCFLADAWCDQYDVVESPIEAILRALKEREVESLGIVTPSEKSDYQSEIAYLAKCLEERGIVVRRGDFNGVQLSSFTEVPANRKKINRQLKPLENNPLWGSLYGLMGKDKLSMLSRCDERLAKGTAREYTLDEVELLEPETKLVAKPEKGTGSIGLKVLNASECVGKKGYVFQEVLVPRNDDFGEVVDGEGALQSAGEWVTRLSIYASSKGLAGAQVTARKREGLFTNVDGKPDAVQTTLAVTIDK